MRPLRIEALALSRFRNLAADSVEPGEAFNVVHGDNGAGKSSLLEAIYYLGALRSFRGAKADDLVALDATSATLEARISGDAVARKARAVLHRGRSRELSFDGKRPRSIAAWHATVQVVLFHPGDVALAFGPAESRRAFLDRVLEQMDPAYASSLASYDKALRSRNRLLKREGTDPRAIKAFDEVLVAAGAVVGSTRARLVSDLAPLVERAFREVVGEAMPLKVEYRPRVEPTVPALRAALERAFAQDVERGMTTLGPHRDDVALDVIDRAPFRHHASQGQHRALVLALKVAELDVLSRRTGRVPILLLDDVSSELDRTRNRRFFEVLARLGGQVFLTTTHAEHILIEESRVDFRVDNGRITRETRD